MLTSPATPSSEHPWSSTVGPDVPGFWVRPGYRVDLVADGLRNARFLQMGDHGDIYMSRPEVGDILTLRMRNGKLETVNTFIDGKQSVHGMQYINGWLWFTQSGAIWKARDANGDGKASEVINVVTGLPKGGHWWRSILVTKDAFYTSIGDPGNITDQLAGDREKIWKYSLDGKTRTVFAGGLRNTEKLLFRPGTDEIYGCDQGSDWYGKEIGDKEGYQPVTDQYPPEEMNHYVEGGFYGHPFIMGAGVPRFEFIKRPDILELAAKTIPPAWMFGPHWAADGWIFLNHDSLGKDSAGDAVVAFHGSWNRQRKAGYRVERVLFDKVTGQPYGNQMLVGTLTEDGKQTLGRPVDVLEMPDGSLLFSDDESNRIYRLSRTSSN